NYRQEVKDYKQETTDLVEDFSENIIEKFTKTIVFAESYGVIGDGITDNTLAIQDAINNTPIGSTLVFAENSEFVISDEIDVTCNVDFRGSYLVSNDLVERTGNRYITIYDDIEVRNLNTKNVTITIYGSNVNIVNTQVSETMRYSGFIIETTYSKKLYNITFKGSRAIKTAGHGFVFKREFKGDTMENSYVSNVEFINCES